jgi:RNA polymerase sigma factor (sigma-70 family)
VRHRYRSQGRTAPKPIRPLTPERKQLAEDNMQLVSGVMNYIKERRWIYSFLLSDEDMRAAGMLGLCKAALNFDPTKGFAFSTYAWSCIVNEIERESYYSQVVKIPNSAFRSDTRRKNGKRKENFCKVFSHQGEYEIPAEKCSQTDVDNKYDANKFLSILNPYHRSLLTSAMENNGNMSEAAREHGVSPQNAQEICRKAIKRIRDRFRREFSSF